MDKTLSSAATLQTDLNGAGAGYDFKALAQSAISILAEREQELGTAETDLEEALEQVKELGSKLDLQEKTKDLPGIAVSIKGVNKMLIGGRFRINKKDYTAQEVAGSPELLDILVSRGSGSLVDPPVTDGSTVEEPAS